MKKYLLKNWLIIGILILATFLRLYKVTADPVSLFGDELDLGYHAYSILKTGRDYQGNFMPIHFHSLAEWRTPLYLYAAVPTVAVFGITPLGVRLPAVIFGVLGIWAIYLLIKEMLSYGTKPAEKHPRALTAAFLLAISPWHLQYSRAGFEVTMLLAFLMFGIYLFLLSLREKGKYLWLSVTLLTFTPWIYSTAKLFTPILLIFLFLMWRSEIMKFSKKILLVAITSGLLIGLPIAYSTIYGGGAQRATYTSVFTDPTVVPEVGNDRTRDYLMRGELVLGAKPTLQDRILHNKFVSWFKVISNNYFESFSLDYLFVKGDPNPRHSPEGVGEFYKVDVIGLMLGLIFFFTGKNDKKIKIFLLFWLVAGAFPASLTRDGGTHSTRLILILPPLIFLLSYGLIEIYRRLSNRLGKLYVLTYAILLIACFASYLHLYYVHYPWDSERWWHAGFQEAIKSVKEVDGNYDKVIISMAGEPAWIFFAAWYQYPPELWQKNFPVGNDIELPGFGKISHTDKFYFGKFSVDGGSLYDLGKYIDSKTLYLAVAREMPPNLIMEPERAPNDLKLLKSVAFPDGEPAYYLFTKK
jgi:4-amino-4-deoxy-L-arabinose transferase-like glycosyltransferase